MITPEQKALRQKGLFSSDIARIMCGYSVSVALEKLGVQDYSEELEDLAEIRLGKITEPIILDAYDNTFGCQVVRSPDTIMHPEYEWMGVHLDAFRPQKNVEAKTAGVYNIPLWGKPGTDKVPDYVLWQGHVGMACTNVMSVDIAVCFLTLEATRNIILSLTSTADIKELPPIYIYTIERDYVLEKALIDRSKAVWQYIQRGETPPPENLADIKLIYTRAIDKFVVAGDDQIADYNRLMELRSLDKELQTEIDSQKFKLQSFMQDAAELKDPNGNTLATWKNDSDGVKVDLGRLENKWPQAYKDCLVPRVGSRKFLPKEVKKKK